MRTTIIIAAALSLSLASCGPKPGGGEISATADDDGNLGQVTLPSGTVAAGADGYAEAVAAETPPIAEMTAMSLTVKPASSAADAGAGGIKLGKFRIQIAPDASYLDGCVRHSFLHLKVVVAADGSDEPFVELHLVAWFQNKTPCFAVMNTGFIGYGWCQKACIKDAKKGVAAAVAGGLAAAGLSAAAAKVSSYLIAPVAVAALAM